MNNLSVRERAMIFAVLLLLIGGLVFVFGIRPLNSKYDELVAQKEAKEAEKRQLDALKQSNSETEKRIKNLEEMCKTIESSFIAEVRTENIIDYVQSELQAAGVPFLVEISTESVATEEIKLPDGTVSNDSLLCTRLTAKYSTTDGRTVEAAGIMQDDGTVLGHLIDHTTGDQIKTKVDEVKNNTNKPNPENPYGYGYDQIIAAINKIAKVNEQCVKISNVVDTGKIGFHEVTVSVDFYGAILNERLSDATTDKSPYAVWASNSTPNFEGGILGSPYRVENELSMWNGYYLGDKEVSNFGYRPFANYLSDAIITKMLKDGNGSRALFADKSNKPADIDTSETTPAA